MAPAPVPVPVLVPVPPTSSIAGDVAGGVDGEAGVIAGALLAASDTFGAAVDDVVDDAAGTTVGVITGLLSNESLLVSLLLLTGPEEPRLNARTLPLLPSMLPSNIAVEALPCAEPPLKTGPDLPSAFFAGDFGKLDNETALSGRDLIESPEDCCDNSSGGRCVRTISFASRIAASAWTVWKQT